MIDVFGQQWTVKIIHVELIQSKIEKCLKLCLKTVMLLCLKVELILKLAQI